MKVAKLILTAGCALLLLGAGCGKSDKDKDKGDKGKAKSTAKAKSSKGKPLDCTAYAAKATKCAAEIEKAYASTKAAKRAGQGDGAKGAALFRRGIDTGMGAGVCKSHFGDRGDERWAICMGKKACGEWAACISPAISDKLHM